jgi:hypothetical protein
MDIMQVYTQMKEDIKEYGSFSIEIVDQDSFHGTRRRDLYPHSTGIYVFDESDQDLTREQLDEEDIPYLYGVQALLDLFHMSLPEETNIDWDGVRAEMAVESEWEENVYDEGWMRSVFLGTVMQLMPSGKYYTFWTSNQTAVDVYRDERYYSLLHEEAEREGFCIENGEGDPCDIFAVEYSLVDPHATVLSVEV